nr:unnamed protein product [Callosobruchus analis]
MNFVWTRERSKRKQHDAGENGRTVGSCFKEKHLYVFHLFLCYDNLREAIKQPGGSSKKLDCSPPGGSSKKLDCSPPGRISLL